MGADHIVDIGKDDPVAMIKQLTRMEGADVMCEMSGHPLRLIKHSKLVQMEGK